MYADNNEKLIPFCDRPLLVDFHIQNYKSFSKNRTALGPLNVLVGPNGSGKSNFVDAITFIKDALYNSSLDKAMLDRGGISAVRRISIGHPTNFGFKAVIDFGDLKGEYSFEVAAIPKKGFRVKRERCIIYGVEGDESVISVEEGHLTKSEGIDISPKVDPERLILPIVGGLPPFSRVYEFLVGVRYYSISPHKMRELQDADIGNELFPDGSNAAAVLRKLEHNTDKLSYETICNLLSLVVPGTKSAKYKKIGNKSTIVFQQDVGAQNDWDFESLNVSDGTLRVLGIILAIFQSNTPTMVLIEEPEATIHPAALEVLIDAIIAGSERSQIVLTTHSPDILDDRDIKNDQIIVVGKNRGISKTGPVDNRLRNVIKKNLYSAGDLFRTGELIIDEEEAAEIIKQTSLF